MSDNRNAWAFGLAVALIIGGAASSMVADAEETCPVYGARRSAIESADCYVPDRFVPLSGGFASDEGNERTWNVVNGVYQRWIWCGTSCWLVLNAVDREVLIIDGFVSKAEASGGDTPGYEDKEGVERVLRLANFLRWLAEDHDFRIVGIVVMHHHGDHTMDVPLLLRHLRAPVGSDSCVIEEVGTDVICGKDRYDAAHAPIGYCIPVIVDLSTNNNYAKPIGNNFADPQTHIVRFNYPGCPLQCCGDPQTCGGATPAEWGAHPGCIDLRGQPDHGVCGSEMSEGFRTDQSFNISQTLMDLDGAQVPCADCREGQFKLGHFEMSAYVWDHQGKRQGLMHSSHRTFALRLWHDKLPRRNARRAFITGTAGEMGEGTCQHDPPVEDGNECRHDCACFVGRLFESAHGHSHRLTRVLAWAHDVYQDHRPKAADDGLHIDKGTVNTDMLFNAWSTAAGSNSKRKNNAVGARSYIRFYDRESEMAANAGVKPWGHLLPNHHDPNSGLRSGRIYYNEMREAFTKFVIDGTTKYWRNSEVRVAKRQPMRFALRGDKPEGDFVPKPSGEWAWLDEKLDNFFAETAAPKPGPDSDCDGVANADDPNPSCFDAAGGPASCDRVSTAEAKCARIGVKNDLVAWWQLDEDEKLDAGFVSPVLHENVCYGNGELVEDGWSYVTPTGGMVVGAQAFDGSYDELHTLINPVGVHDPTEVSLDAWVNLAGVPGRNERYGIVGWSGIDALTAQRGYDFTVNSDGELEFRAYGCCEPNANDPNNKCLGVPDEYVVTRTLLAANGLDALSPDDGLGSFDQSTSGGPDEFETRWAHVGFRLGGKGAPPTFVINGVGVPSTAAAVCRIGGCQTTHQGIMPYLTRCAGLNYQRWRVGSTSSHDEDQRPMRGKLDEVEVFENKVPVGLFRRIYEGGRAGKCENRVPATCPAAPGLIGGTHRGPTLPEMSEGETIKCRAAHVKRAAKFVKAAIRGVDDCYASALKGVGVSSACGSLPLPDAKLKLESLRAKWESAYTDPRSKCFGTPEESDHTDCSAPCDVPDADVETFGDVASCTSCLLEASIASFASRALGAPPGTPSAAELKCHAVLRSGAFGIVEDALKRITKCQSKLEKAKPVAIEEVDACVHAHFDGPRFAAAEAKLDAAVAKACTEALPPASSWGGECDTAGPAPLSACVADLAVAHVEGVVPQLYSLGDRGKHPSFCGDHEVTPTTGEECDPPFALGGAVGCAADCTFRCGDGTLDGDLGEVCDDGAANSDTVPDACRTGCGSPYCGDGVVDSVEDCDDRDSLEGGPCTSSCETAACGDGELCADPACTSGPGGGPEECDPPYTSDDSSTISCSNACEVLCGNGTLDAASGEECDDGNANSDLAADACRSDCLLPHCGDGVTDAGEECDPGDTAEEENHYPCTTECLFAVCGDGYVCSDDTCTSGPFGGGEACDPPFASGGESGCSVGCDNTCGDGTVDAINGETCDTSGASLTCDHNCTAPACGDLTVNESAGEDCDDGNAIAGDGCSPSCVEETCACIGGPLTGRLCLEPETASDECEGAGCVCF
jgi:cysteine-rich repeat protein